MTAKPSFRSDFWLGATETIGAITDLDYASVLLTTAILLLINPHMGVGAVYSSILAFFLINAVIELGKSFTQPKRRRSYEHN